MSHCNASDNSACNKKTLYTCIFGMIMSITRTPLVEEGTRIISVRAQALLGDYIKLQFSETHRVLLPVEEICCLAIPV